MIAWDEVNNVIVFVFLKPNLFWYFLSLMNFCFEMGTANKELNCNFGLSNLSSSGGCFQAFTLKFSEWVAVWLWLPVFPNSSPIWFGCYCRPENSPSWKFACGHLVLKFGNFGGKDVGCLMPPDFSASWWSWTHPVYYREIATGL